MALPIFKFLLPAAARMVGSRGIGRLFSKMPRGRGRQDTGQMNIDFGDKFNPKGTRFQRYGGGIGDLGGGALEAGYGIDTFDDPEADLFDKAIGGALGLGGFGLMRRGGRRILTSARGGGKSEQEAILGEKRPLATLGGVKYALPLTGLQIGKEMVTGDPEPVQVEKMNISQDTALDVSNKMLNEDQRNVLNQFMAQYGSYDNADNDAKNLLANELTRLATPDKNQTTTVNQDGSETKGNNTAVKEQNEVIQQNNPDKSIISEENVEGGIKQADISSTQTIQTTSNPTGAKGGPKGLAGTGPIDDLFDLLSVKENAYDRSNAAIEKYKDQIKDQRSKIQSFDQYKKAFTEYTGDDNDQSKNIALFKWAMNMMTGTTSQGGFAGLLDVAGKAGVEIADDLQAINSQEQAENRDLAIRYMQYEQDANKSFDQLERDAFKMNIESLRAMENNRITDLRDYRDKLFQYNQKKMEVQAAAEKATRDANNLDKIIYKQIPSANTALGTENVRVGVTKDGRTMVSQKDPASGAMRFVEATGDMADVIYQGGEIKQSPKGRRTALAGMQSASMGLNYINQVEQIVASGQDLALPAYANRFTLQFGATLKDMFGLFGGTAPGGAPGLRADFLADDFDSSFQKVMIAQYAEENPNVPASEYNKVIKQFNKDNRDALDRYNSLVKQGSNSKFYKEFEKTMQQTKKGAERLRQLDTQEKKDQVARNIATLSIIENRMKYIIANSNKAEDRLTQKDIDAAAESTRIFSIAGGSSVALEKYKALKSELNGKFRNSAQLYAESGGGSDIIHSFENTDLVKQWKNNMAQGGQAPQQVSPAERAKIQSEIQNEVLQYLGGS